MILRAPYPRVASKRTLAPPAWPGCLVQSSSVAFQNVGGPSFGLSSSARSPVSLALGCPLAEPVAQRLFIELHGSSGAARLALRLIWNKRRSGSV
jgi:hypothetical protein